MILRLSIPNPPTPPKALKSLWLPQSHAPPSLLSGSVFWGEKHPLHNPSYPSPAQPRHKVKEVLATSQASLSISQCLGVTLGAKFAHPTQDSRKSEHLQRYEVSKKFLNEIIWSCPADTRNPPFNTGKQRGGKGIPVLGRKKGSAKVLPRAGENCVHIWVPVCGQQSAGTYLTSRQAREVGIIFSVFEWRNITSQGTHSQ